MKESISSKEQSDDDHRSNPPDSVQAWVGPKTTKEWIKEFDIGERSWYTYRRNGILIVKKAPLKKWYVAKASHDAITTLAKQKRLHSQ